MGSEAKCMSKWWPTSKRTMPCLMLVKAIWSFAEWRVCVSLIFSSVRQSLNVASRRATAIRNTTRGKQFFFRGPILFLDTFCYWISFVWRVFSALHWLCRDSFTYILYILIFINLGGAIKIHILHIRSRRKALLENMAAEHTHRHTPSPNVAANAKKSHSYRNV